MSDTNVQLVLNSRDRTSGTYNSSLFNAKGQNIIQGSIKQITVSEVNFPYDIPNVQAGFNVFQILTNGTSPLVLLDITVTPGFYTGSELADAINAAIVVQGGLESPTLTAAQMPTFEFDGTTNTFLFKAPTAPLSANYDLWFLSSPYLFPNLTNPANNTLGKDLLTIMGFQQAALPPEVDATIPADSVFRSGAAPLVFTQYVDICSSQLCKNQYMSDGSTTNLARRSDVICRLFVCDNVSLTTAEVDGTRPFIINRQYYNARMMKWTVGAAIGTVDINLYDDVGQPLLTTWAPRPFQITFNCHESPRSEGL